MLTLEKDGERITLAGLNGAFDDLYYELEDGPDRPLESLSFFLRSDVEKSLTLRDVDIWLAHGCPAGLGYGREPDYGVPAIRAYSRYRTAPFHVLWSCAFLQGGANRDERGLFSQRTQIRILYLRHRDGSSTSLSQWESDMRQTTPPQIAIRLEPMRPEDLEAVLLIE